MEYKDKRRNTEGIPIKCPCGYSWFYTGEGKYPMCTKCFSRISLAKHRTDSKRREENDEKR